MNGAAVLTDAAVNRERSRAAHAMTGATMMLGFGAGSGLTLHSGWGLLIAGCLIVAALVFGVPWVIVRSPRKLTPLRSRMGSWTATAAIMTISSAVARPGLPDTAELLGKVVLTPSSTVWVPNAPSAKNFQATQITWGNEYMPYARRLPGYGQVHVALVAEDRQTVDLWLHFAFAMPVP
jgi:hypothetical protein